jgi:hypothetical protein
MKQGLASVAACLLLAACATPTVYGPRTGPNASGFSEMRIEADRFRVSYTGGNGASPDQVADYALLRAAEITVAQGYDWYRVVEQFTQGTAGRGPQMSVGGGSASFGRRSSVGVGLGTSFDLSGGPQLTRNLEIKLGRGVKPDDAYDATDVIRTIGPRVPGARRAG